MDIGFNGLKIKILDLRNDRLNFKVIDEGFLENNKGVHIINRKIKLNFLTKKDLQAIKVGKNFNIKNFALSFTNSYKDIINFKKLLKSENKIYKIETSKAINNFEKMLKYGDNFLIDRGDLSKDILIENIPIAQRKIISKAKRKKKQKYFHCYKFFRKHDNKLLSYKSRGK